MKRYLVLTAFITTIGALICTSCSSEPELIPDDSPGHERIMPYKGTWGVRILLPSNRQNSALEQFDVDAFINQVVQLETISHVMINLNNGHSGSSYLASHPGLAAAVDSSLFPSRDLFGEVLTALEENGLRALVYFSAPGFDRDFMSDSAWNAWQAFLLSEGMSHYEAVAERVLKYYADQYGNKIAGWWFDRVNHAPMSDWEMQLFIEAVRSGNPDAIVAYSRSTGSPLKQGSLWCDYTAGHPTPMIQHPPWWDGNEAMINSIEQGPWINQEGTPSQTSGALGQIFMPLQSLWTVGEADFPTDLAIDWLSRVLDSGGMYTWAVARKGSLFTEPQFSQLKAMDHAIQTN